MGLPLDIRFSGLLNLGSGTPYRVFYGGDACATGNMDCIQDFPGGDPSVPWGGTNPYTGEPEKQAFLGIEAFAFRNVDLRLQKEFGTFGGQRIGLVAEVFNAFNFENFNGYMGRIGNLQPNGTVTPNPESSEVNSVITDTRLQGAPRRWQFGLRYTI